MKKNILLIIGTRPEAIKMAPVYLELLKSDILHPILMNTGQHRDMITPVLNDFGIHPDFNLDLMTSNQSVAVFMAEALSAIHYTISKMDTPAAVLVHGDTTTALAGAMAAFYLGIPIGHVEAGLRTHDIREPFPEEMNRQVIDRISSWYFTPTREASHVIHREGDHGTVHQNFRGCYNVGNTVIDAMRIITEKNIPVRDKTLEFLLLNKTAAPYLLMTAHRRENHGKKLEALFEAVKTFCRNKKINILFPVHPNPNVRTAALKILANQPGIILTDPLDYPDFIKAMDGSSGIITDSGGIQEESIYLKKPVFLFRDQTERPEAMADDGGNIVFMGTDALKLLESLYCNYSEPYAPEIPITVQPFGDGTAALKIVHELERTINKESLHHGR